MGMSVLISRSYTEVLAYISQALADLLHQYQFLFLNNPVDHQHRGSPLHVSGCTLEWKPI